MGLTCCGTRSVPLPPGWCIRGRAAGRWFRCAVPVFRAAQLAVDGAVTEVSDEPGKGEKGEKGEYDKVTTD